MKINKVIINSVRNILSAEFSPIEQFNCFFGPNGSGKTTILECLYYLAHARSFRSHLTTRVINLDAELMTLYGELNSPENQKISLGIQRDTEKLCKIHLQQKVVKSASELASLLPMILINPDSFNLLDGGPKPRRALLDWGLFHVEQLYYPLWQRFQRCLKQRNASLRAKLSDDEVMLWDVELSGLAHKIDNFRRAYCEQLIAKFDNIMKEFLPLEHVNLIYTRGWPKDAELKELLFNGLGKDRERGYTYAGPQRADILLKINNIPLQDFLSRGQQKLVVCALRIAQAQLLYDLTSKESIFLIDDLPSELGPEYREFLIQSLHKLNAQVFITAIEAASLIYQLPSNSCIYMVLGGIIKESSFENVPRGTIIQE